MLFLFMQDGHNVCHIVAATHSADVVGVAELLTVHLMLWMLM